MSKVLFSHSYFYKLDPKQWRFKQPYPPLATILAAAVVRDAGFEVSLFDTNLRDSPTDILPLFSKYDPKYFVLYDDSFNYLSKMCLTNMREAAFRMAAWAKERGCIVIASSSDAADHYEKYLQRGVDYVVRGEGEETLKELLIALENEKDVSSIMGLVFDNGYIIKRTGERPVMKNLDALPLPAWDLVDIESYRRIWIKHHGYFSLNLATTRGCPFKCNWCAKPIYGNRYTSRSPENVVQEITFLLHQYKPDHFWMCDDIFGLKPGWVQAFGKIVEERGLSFKFKIQSRADLLLEEDTIQALAKAGIETVWMGAESGSQKVLDAMDKGTTIEQIRQATVLLKQHHINVAFFLQLGYLGETRSDIDATINLLLELMPDEVGISVSYPLPGTKFYEKVKNQLQEKQNWTDSDDLAMMFQGTYNSNYYKHLHRYVHSLYRRKKGSGILKKIISNPLKLRRNEIKPALATFYFAVQSYLLSKRLLKLNQSNFTSRNVHSLTS
jgi:anaerobic magnesium-protoporphyrin IX monomethyl ester cyclase